MDEQRFAERLTALRMGKNVSAREMSLAIGQNPSYINRIENRLAYPSMQCFFYICEYLEISPAEFFQYELPAPEQLKELSQKLGRLDARQLGLVDALVDGLLEKK